ncbi:hypothetical protein HA45_15255 [Pantoea rodasii]|uniref:hypothetical protein n=1 Tax=Pantoea rodasii TaxID=1076549 RepID=UPI000A252558|nr:hypothetical protein [Pantoea rodasii]ORM63228.1 hypothetical protein HA45_15255 [Pantoea rodasii]
MYLTITHGFLVTAVVGIEPASFRSALFGCGFLVEFIAFLFVLTINHRLTKRLRAAVRNGVKTCYQYGGTMSHGEPGNYGDESYPFCMNEAKNTVWLHELICKNPSRCTKKPASEWPVKGGKLQGGVTGGD